MEGTRILYLTSVNHPRVYLEAQSLGRLFEVDYVFVKFDISNLKSYIVSLIKKFPPLLLALVTLRIPPIPVRKFLSNVLIAGSLIDNLCLRNKLYDVIYANWLFPAGFVGVVLSKVLHTKVISEIGGYDIQVVPGVGGYGIAGLRRILSKYVLIRSDSITVKYRIHEELAVRAAGTNCRNKILYIPQGLPDIARHSADKNPLPVELKKRLDNFDGNIILYSPSLKPIYGITEYVRAIPLVVSRIDRCLFVIAGEGELKDRAMRFVQDRGLNDRVIFIGKVSHDSMISLYRLSSIVCDLCYAGQGTTTLEAFCFGKPVVGIATAKKLIEHGKNGFLVTRGDYETLAHYISELLLHDRLMEEMSRKARKSFEQNFTLEMRLRKLVELFNFTTSKTDRNGKTRELYEGT